MAPNNLMIMKSKLRCPSCEGDEIKEIIYGLPDPEHFDFEKYEVGGCLVSDDDQTYKCSSCNYSW